VAWQGGLAGQPSRYLADPTPGSPGMPGTAGKAVNFLDLSRGIPLKKRAENKFVGGITFLLTLRRKYENYGNHPEL
jgi:hypothetical protein